MKWVMKGGHAHALVEDEPPQLAGACGVQIDPDEVGDSKDAPGFEGRPFGADTCPVCHAIVKGWHAEPDTAPEGLHDPEPPTPRKLTAADRARIVRGEPVEDRPSGPPTGRAGRSVAPVGTGDDPDDLVFPDEGSPGLASVAGAIVVPPSPGKRRAKAKSDDIDIDS